MGKGNGSDIEYYETGDPSSKSVSKEAIENHLLDSDSDYKRRHPIRFLVFQFRILTANIGTVMKEKLRNAHFLLKKYVQMSISMIRLVCQTIKSKGHAMTNKTKEDKKVTTKSNTENTTGVIMVSWQFALKIVKLFTVIGILYGAIVIYQGTKELNMVLPMVPACVWALVTLVRQFTK